MVKEDKTQQVSGQFKLRLPNGLRVAIERQAALNRRSLNSEIVVCLEKVIGIEPETLDGNRT